MAHPRPSRHLPQCGSSRALPDGHSRGTAGPFARQIFAVGPSPLCSTRPSTWSDRSSAAHTSSQSATVYNRSRPSPGPSPPNRVCPRMSPPRDHYRPRVSESRGGPSHVGECSFYGECSSFMLCATAFGYNSSLLHAPVAGAENPRNKSSTRSAVHGARRLLYGGTTTIVARVQSWRTIKKTMR